MAGAIGAGSMFQANQAYSQFLDITGGADGPLAGRGWLFGLVITTLAGVVGATLLPCVTNSRTLLLINLS